MHLHTRFHVPTSCSSLIIVVRLNTMFMQQPYCFYILPKKIAFIKVAVFEAVMSHIISGSYMKVELMLL